ncbi:MAG: MBL fold metallo-hydrolase [Elusimicrobia bacterium]|nr:MBL fold metallo-hydrolase [Elusimicrobiota bacterium]
MGQGDAEYIELPNGKTVLIDGGPGDPDKPGYPPVSRFLAEHNVTKLDYVVLTHPHADHYEGLQYVFSNIKVGNFYDTRMDNTGAAGDNALREQVKKLGVNTTYPAAGDTFAWDPEVQVKVLHGCPETDQSSDGNVLNDCSIVLKVTYQNTSILYTGDIQDDAVPSLTSKFGRGGLQADVLKVSHHGSRYATGSEFLDLVRPKAAYIEVGYNNFGHPSDATLARLKAAGAAVYRTDLSGTLEYRIGGGLTGPAAYEER